MWIVPGEQRLDRGADDAGSRGRPRACGMAAAAGDSGVGGAPTGRGIAIGIYHAGSYMAQVAVSFGGTGPERVSRAPGGVRAGLRNRDQPAGDRGASGERNHVGPIGGAAREIDSREGRVVQQGYHDFRVMQMGEMPVVETHILPSEAAPGGFGEHAVPPVAPAVANALFAATGKRLRRLPLRLR